MLLRIKRTRIRTTKWNLFFLYTTIVYNIIIAIVLVPLYLKFIPKETYGYWLASGNILAWLTVIDPGLGAVIEQKIAYNYGSKDFYNIGQYTTAGLLVSVTFIFIILIIGIIFSYNFTGWLGVTNKNIAYDLKIAFNFSLVGTGLMLLSYTLVSINKGLQSSLGTGLIFTFVNITNIVLLIFLLNKGYGIKSLGIALLWRGLIFVMGNIFYLLWRIKIEKIKFSLGKKIFRDFTSLMSYNFMGKLGVAFSTQMSSFFIARVLSPVDVTILKFTQSVPEMSKLILVRPSIALTSPLTHLIGEKEENKAKIVLSKLILFLIWGSGLFFSCFVILNKLFIILWVGIEFYTGDMINFLIVILLLITAFTNSITPIVFALGNIKTSSTVIFIQGIFYLLLLIIGVNILGLMGVVIAALVAELVSIWYFPKNLFKRIKLNKNEQSTIKNEFIKSLSISIFIIIISSLFFIKEAKWLILIIQSSLIVLAYGGLLFTVSSLFKKWILELSINLRKRIKIKIRNTLLQLF